MAQPERADRVQVYREKKKGKVVGYRWRYKDGYNGKIMADSGEAYVNLKDLWESMYQVLGLIKPPRGWRFLNEVDEGVDSAWSVPRYNSLEHGVIVEVLKDA